MTKFDPESRSSREQLAINIMAKLTECGFEPVDIEGCNEAVYARTVNDSVRILVYTTIVAAPFNSFQVRPNGKDAIRVCAVYKSDRTKAERGITSEGRTNRTGTLEAICKRMHTRMRNSWAAVGSNKPCGKCGVPTFRSKGGRDTCCDLCWKTDAQLARPYSPRRNSKYRPKNRTNYRRW